MLVQAVGIALVHLPPGITFWLEGILISLLIARIGYHLYRLQQLRKESRVNST